MKITSISCDQFAGIIDKNVSLKDGVNVICGENESGKSTIVNLLSRTLFQTPYLNKRSDKAFIESCFPCDKKNGLPKGDCIDGKVAIEHDGKKYIISKEWGEDSSIKLKTSDGTVIKNQDTINEIMKEILVYGEGVYSDILFSTQYNTSQSLKTILDASKSNAAKDELNSTISRAFAESDNISIDKIEKNIADKIAVIEGAHWDRDGGRPMVKRGGGKWSSGIGEILKAYYDVMDWEESLKTIAALESEVIATAEAYDKLLQAYQTAEKAHSDFLKHSGDIKLSKELYLKASNLESGISAAEADLKAWPKIIEAIKTAEKLKTELDARQILDRYNSAKEYFDKTEALKAEIAEITPPADSEIELVRKAEETVANLENKLKGMNLSACVRLFGGNKAQVKIVRTGEIIDINDENISIDEAVIFIIPGVVEMALSPKSVNSEEINAEISRIKDEQRKIFEKYNVDSLENLVSLSECAKSKAAEHEKYAERLALILDGTDYAALKNQASSITVEIRPANDIKTDIQSLCKCDVSVFIAAKKAAVENYEKAHESVARLQEKIKDNKKVLEDTRKKLGEINSIPEEYFKVDVDTQALTLEKNKQTISNECNEALSEKTNAQSRLDSFKENLEYEPHEALENAKARYEEKKSELESWVHIQQVFLEQKANLSGNSSSVIADKFAEYLSIISGSRLSADFPDADKLDMEIYSGDNHLTYDMLSEGTKDTVSLAFRLAVVDHLFPDGNGVVILDDPFTDMDEKRTEKSCELVKKCAERHQVIFLTCKKEIAEMLSGNLIEFDE